MENYEKKYKEVLEKAKALYKASEPMSGCNVIIETLFPELKSEDEKVRKELIKHLKELSDWKEDEVIPVKNPSYYRQWASWLEKQGEKKASYTTIAETGNGGINALVTLPIEMKTAEESLGVDSKTYNKIVDECIFDEQNDSCVKDYNNIDPHFGKSIDKTESKFHEGEWITNGDYTWKIVEVKPLDYILQSQDGNVVDDTISHVDEQFHSFTIEDAKPGDVLVCKGDIKYSNGIKYEKICLFNNLDNAFFTLTKASNYKEGYDIDVNIDYPDNIVPATKEQKEILFMAMANAGYTFDFKKKELKEIEQKSIDSYCQENCKGFQETGKCFADGECKAKREAEQELTDLNEFINELSKQFPDISFAKLSRIVVRVAKWAKSNQPRQEWSEEDEINVYNIIHFLEEPSTLENNEPCKKIVIAWLKSLRPQNRWKPSDEQIKVCKEVYADLLSAKGFDLGTVVSELNRLEEGLKKKGE